MVYHNLSMSLNHHVPIFNCTVTIWGGVSLSNCKLRVLSATSLASSAPHTHTHTHTDTHRYGRIWLRSCPVSTPPPYVTSPVLGHVTLLYIDCGHFGFKLHIQCPFVYTTDALHKRRYTSRRQTEMKQSLQRDHFQAFSNMEETHTVVCLCFFPSLSILQKTRSYFLKFPVI